MRSENWDVVVVGSGLSGIVTALSLAPRRTLLVTKTPTLRSGSTPWAQGGIAFPIDEADIPVHIQDTVTSGDGYGDPLAIDFLVRRAPEVLAWLESLSFPFDRTPDGDYDRGREGAHSRRRILHSHGDSTGAALFDFFQDQIEKAVFVELRTSTFAVEAVHNQEGVVAGLWVWDLQGPLFLRTNRLVLASGGYGQVFSRTTAPPESTGDGTALAVLAGAALRDAEMIQFHPTGLNVEGTNQVPLLTEALRGDGADLVTSDAVSGDPPREGELKPLTIAHPLGSLGPRDLVARAVFERQQAGHPVWLDTRKVEHLDEHFPTASSFARQNGWDPKTTPLPVAPVAHYIMGGVRTDLSGKTKVPGLYAVGEVASTGVHGANRLASNSLLECLVFGRACAQEIDTFFSAKSSLQTDFQLNPCDPSRVPSRVPPVDVSLAFRKRIQEAAFEAAGPVRNEESLRSGLKKLNDRNREWTLVKDEASARPSSKEPPEETVRAFLETENLFLVAEKVLTAALANRTNHGAHFRSDALFE